MSGVLGSRSCRRSVLLDEDSTRRCAGAVGSGFSPLLARQVQRARGELRRSHRRSSLLRRERLAVNVRGIPDARLRRSRRPVDVLPVRGRALAHRPGRVGRNLVDQCRAGARRGNHQSAGGPSVRLDASRHRRCDISDRAGAPALQLSKVHRLCGRHSSPVGIRGSPALGNASLSCDSNNRRFPDPPRSWRVHRVVFDCPAHGPRWFVLAGACSPCGGLCRDRPGSTRAILSVPSVQRRPGAALRHCGRVGGSGARPLLMGLAVVQFRGPDRLPVAARAAVRCHGGQYRIIPVLLATGLAGGGAGGTGVLTFS